MRSIDTIKNDSCKCDQCNEDFRNVWHFNSFANQQYCVSFRIAICRKKKKAESFTSPVAHGDGTKLGFYVVLSGRESLTSLGRETNPQRLLRRMESLVQAEKNIAQIFESQQSQGSNRGPCDQKPEILPTAPNTPAQKRQLQRQWLSILPKQRLMFNHKTAQILV